MRFLPKANPLYEKINAAKVSIPDVLEKLGKGGFTGYLSHTAPGFESYCIFAKGKLLCAVSSEGDRDKAGFEGIALLFDKVISSGGEVNVYRMTADLAMCAHALVLGTRLHHGDEVRLVDIKAMLARMKTIGLNGVVHFYTQARFGMIFYKDGAPIGFYHDGATAIESSPDESRKVAALPGARVDVCSTKAVEELLHSDLLQMVNLGKLWETALSRHSAPRHKEETPVNNGAPAVDESKLSELVEDLSEVAIAYLSKDGRRVIEKRLGEAGGPRLLLDHGKTAQFLARIESDARTIDSHARIDEMIDLMKSEIAGRLAV